jgi:hypothetical protein
LFLTHELQLLDGLDGKALEETGEEIYKSEN